MIQQIHEIEIFPGLGPKTVPVQVVSFEKQIRLQALSDKKHLSLAHLIRQAVMKILNELNDIKQFMNNSINMFN